MDLVSFAMDLEDSFGIEYLDTDIEEAITLADIYQATISKLSTATDVTEVKETIIALASKCGYYSVGELELSMRLDEVLAGRVIPRPKT